MHLPHRSDHHPNPARSRFHNRTLVYRYKYNLRSSQMGSTALILVCPIMVEQTYECTRSPSGMVFLPAISTTLQQSRPRNEKGQAKGMNIFTLGRGRSWYPCLPQAPAAYLAFYKHRRADHCFRPHQILTTRYVSSRYDPSQPPLEVLPT